MFYRHVNLLVSVFAVMTHASAVLAQSGMGGGVSGTPQPFNAQFAAFPRDGPFPVRAKIATAKPRWWEDGDASPKGVLL